MKIVLVDVSWQEGVSASKYRIVSFNCNSVGKQPKRGQVLQYIMRKKPDILVLVDTRLSKDIENVVKCEMDGHIIFSSFSSQSRGVLIYIQKNLPIKLLDDFSDDEGNIAAVLFEIENKRILLEGIYGPNLDNPSFYSEKVFKRIEDWDPNFAIYVGDWNIALDQTQDTKGYKADNNIRAREELIKQMNDLDLVDVYRELNPDGNDFTWKKWGGKQFARLDYFLISNTLLPFIQKVATLPRCYSDHNAVIMELDFAKFQRGRGFWKFNNSLLYDPDYVELIKQTIKQVVCQYSIVNNDENFFEHSSREDLEDFLHSQTPETLQNFPSKLNDELFLDTLLLAIRGASIKYSSAKKKRMREKELSIISDIETLERNLHNRLLDEDVNIDIELNEKKI